MTSLTSTMTLGGLLKHQSVESVVYEVNCGPEDVHMHICNVTESQCWFF